MHRARERSAGQARPPLAYVAARDLALDSVPRYGVNNGGRKGQTMSAIAILRTGELARQAGVNVETLRFYERKGLLPAPPRRASGYREYPAEAVGLVRFIRRAKELGFSLREIKELLNIRAGPRATCADSSNLQSAGSRKSTPRSATCARSVRPWPGSSATARAPRR